MFDLSVPWWELVVRAVIVYVFILVLFRLTGKRQIGEYSPMDFVLLLILADAVQNSINAGDNSIVGGLISAVVLVALNYLVGFVAFRSKRIERLLEGEPQIIIRDGEVRQRVLDKEQITHAELLEALRAQGCSKPSEVRLAVLECDGKISVIKRESGA